MPARPKTRVEELSVQLRTRINNKLRFTKHEYAAPECYPHDIWLVFHSDIPWPIATAAVLTHPAALKDLSPTGAPWIEYLHVLSNFRREGVGRSLVETIRDRYGSVDGPEPNAPGPRCFFESLRKADIIPSGAIASIGKRASA